MKIRIAGLFISGLLCAAAHGQGTILFSTFVPGAANVNAPAGIAFAESTEGFGKFGGSAQLYLLSGGTYTALSPATTFRTGTSSPMEQFYVVPPSDAVVVPGIGAGEQATIVMRAWAGAPTFDAALLRGESAPVIITLGGTPAGGGAPLPPAFLTGMQGFVLLAPEPSVMALALLGGALFLCKRKA